MQIELTQGELRLTSTTLSFTAANIDDDASTSAAVSLDGIRYQVFFHER